MGGLTFMNHKLQHTGRIGTAYTIAASRIDAIASTKKSDPAVYKAYLERINDMVDVVLNFDWLTQEQREQMAVAIFVGTAMDYSKKEDAKEETLSKIVELPFDQDPHAIKMFDWAREYAPLTNLRGDQVIVTTAWLLNDGETWRGYLAGLPHELKSMMKRVHNLNFENAGPYDFPAPIQQRLRTAHESILSL